MSVDAFHQQTIPLDTVRCFARELKRVRVPVRFQPAWLVSREDNNPYNRKTREILESLTDLQIPISEGNIIYPEGNACRYLNEYFSDTVVENPYVENPYDVRCLSFSPNGDVLNGNVYREDIFSLLKRYAPKEDEI